MPKYERAPCSCPVSLDIDKYPKLEWTRERAEAYWKLHTPDCTKAHYAAHAAWEQSEELRMEAIASVRIAADIIEPSLSGQYGRFDALEIAEEVVEALLTQFQTKGEV